MYDEIGEEIAIEQSGDYTLFEYDLLNRMVSVSKVAEDTGALDQVVSYRYNHKNLRIEWTDDEGTTRYVFDLDGSIIEEHDAEGLTRYVFRNNKHLAKIAADGKAYYYGTDMLGSTTVLFDDAGNAVWKGEISAFGDVVLGEWIREELFDERVKFTGKDYDEVTGLYYFNARWYDPQLGRFTSEDPVRDGMNWYVYVRNNPLRFIDPTGLENVLINNEGLFPTIDEIDIGAGDFADGALAGLASVANIPSSLANMALQAAGTTLGTADAVIDAVDNLIPDSMSLTGGGLKEDLFVTGLFVGMNPQTTSGFMLSMKHGIKSATGKIFGGKGNIAKGVQKSLKDQAVDLIPQNANRNRTMLRSSSQQMEVDLARRAHNDVLTPHTKISLRNYNAPNRPAYNMKNSPVQPATQQDIRTVRKYLERQDK